MDEKGKGIIAYVFGLIGGLIVLLAFKKDNNKKTTIHACQSITISIAVLAVNIAYNLIPFTIPMFSTVVWALQVVLIVLGIVRVVKDEDPELPVIGGIAKSLFSKAIEEAPETVVKEEKKEEK